MTRIKLFASITLGVALAVVGAAVGAGSCTPAQLDVARPLVRSGGLVCLAVPGEDREVCARNAELVQAVFASLDEQGAFTPAPSSSADLPTPAPEPSAPPPEAGPAASASPEPAGSVKPE